MTMKLPSSRSSFFWVVSNPFVIEETNNLCFFLHNQDECDHLKGARKERKTETGQMLYGKIVKWLWLFDLCVSVYGGFCFLFLFYCLCYSVSWMFLRPLVFRFSPVSLFAISFSSVILAFGHFFLHILLVFVGLSCCHLPHHSQIIYSLG